jgi:citrate synthase
MANASKRLTTIENHLKPTGTLKIEDTRTGKKYEVNVFNNYIDAKDLAQIKSESGDVLRSYDPAYMNTISCTSRISYIDGDAGILQYRGYPIEELAEKSTFMEVAFLLLYGELPTQNQFNMFEGKVMTHTMLHTDVENMMRSFHYDAHPMGMVVSTLAAVSTFHPEVNPALHAGVDVYADEKVMNKQIHRIVGQISTIAACAYRHRIGRRFNIPSKGMSYVENFMCMMDRLNEPDYRPHPVLVKALDVLFLLHADHELNCSTAEMRHLASSEVDVYTCIAGATAALYGRRHGGANEGVLRMLENIGKVENIPAFIEQVKAKKAIL